MELEAKLCSDSLLKEFFNEYLCWKVRSRRTLYTSAVNVGSWENVLRGLEARHKNAHTY